MLDLSTQFRAIIKPRIDLINKKVSGTLAEFISDDMNENSARGTAFGNDEFQNSYSERSVNDRTSMGLQSHTVELRRGNNRIENTKIITTGKGSTISFIEGGKIFKEHHTGEALLAPFDRTVPVRSIFPKKLESVPKSIREEAVRLTGEVLRGQIK